MVVSATPCVFVPPSISPRTYSGVRGLGYAVSRTVARGGGGGAVEDDSRAICIEARVGRPMERDAGGITLLEALRQNRAALGFDMRERAAAPQLHVPPIEPAIPRAPAVSLVREACSTSPRFLV